MSRRAVLTTLAGAVLVSGLATPALSAPSTEQSLTQLCLRTDSEDGRRDGICVLVPGAER